MKLPTELKTKSHNLQNELVLNNDDTFTKYFETACIWCGCKNYCQQKGLCCWLHDENLAVCERFICRLEKLFETCFYFTVHAESNEKLLAETVLFDLFAEHLCELHERFTECEEELKPQNRDYCKTLMRTMFKTYLDQAHCLKYYEELYGKLAD